MDRHDTRPIFIGGHHRSGTTLLRVMLNRHPNIACGPEGALLERTGFQQFHQYLEDSWRPQFDEYGFGPADVDRAVAAFVDNFFARYAAQRNKTRWAEKTPRNILRIDYLFRLFPEARFIHMVRDPRDVHCSVRDKAATTSPHWSAFTAERTALSWTEYVHKGLVWRDDHRFLEVQYERLVQDPTSAMKTIVAFVDEPWDDRLLQSKDDGTGIEELPNVDRPIFANSVGRWRQDLPADDLDRIEAIAGETMRRVGYEPSRSGDVSVSERATGERSRKG